MYEYRCNIERVVDGDTVDVDIDLGFGIWLRSERVRIMGIDTPESRKRDKVEKKDMKGKFGRILGDFDVYSADSDSWRPVTKVMVEEGHAVEYFGGSKDDVDAAHLANRERLIKEGAVTLGQ